MSLEAREIGLVPPSPNIWVDAKTGATSGLLPGVWQACSEEEFRVLRRRAEAASQGTAGFSRRRRASRARADLPVILPPGFYL